MKIPFDQYYALYKKNKCPFCGADIDCLFEEGKVVFCSFYGGYVSEDQDSTFGDGECPGCDYHDSYRHVAPGRGFLCENCHHGVEFDEMKVFQELFHLHDVSSCNTCRKHELKAHGRAVEKPKN